MRTRPIVRALEVCVTALCLHLAVAVNVYAQAWLPERGEGQVSLTYEDVFVRYHLNFTGAKRDRGPIRAHTTTMSVEYGLTNRLALDTQVARVSSKYGGPFPESPIDNGSYHPTFQDARVGLRYNALSGPVVLTPFIAVVIPTHDYEALGHSAVGRGFHELQIGVNVGKALESMLKGGYVHARYSFAIVQRVGGFNLNRSNADWELGSFVSSRFSMRFTGQWQMTHGGIELLNGVPLPVPSSQGGLHFNDTPEEHLIHDRVARANLIRLGGGATFSVSKSLDLHLDYIRTVSGINTHAARGIALGMSWRFSRGLSERF